MKKSLLFIIYCVRQFECQEIFQKIIYNNPYEKMSWIRVASAGNCLDFRFQYLCNNECPVITPASFDWLHNNNEKSYFGPESIYSQFIKNKCI